MTVDSSVMFLCSKLSPVSDLHKHCHETDYILITNLMHWLLFIHKILFCSTRFEHQVLIFRRT